MRHVTDSPALEVEPAPHFTLRYLLRAMYLRRVDAAAVTLSGPCRYLQIAAGLLRLVERDVDQRV